MTTHSTTPSVPTQPGQEQAAQAGRDLKARHRAMWASGDYPDMAARLVAPLGPELVRAAGITSGATVLDVAAGTGNAALPAAELGATVTASDLTPELLDAGRRVAEERGLELSWDEADAENLPYADAAYDVVISCIGAMFAPQHQAVTDELVRVTRPGGRIALLNWTPAGLVGQLFVAMKSFMPPPPPGAQPPPLWGDPDHVAALFGDRVTDLEATTGSLPVTMFPGETDLRELFAAEYGPTIVAYRNAGEERRAELDAAIDEVAARFRQPDGSMEWEYVVITGRRT